MISFGDSPAARLTSCPWYEATYNSTHNETNANCSSVFALVNQINSIWDSGNSIATHGCLYNTLDNVWSYAQNQNSTANTAFLALNWCGPLFINTPSSYTNTPLLVPIRILVNRPTANSRTFALSLQNCRVVRLDNNQPEDVLTFGSETWKVYPFFRRDGNQTVLNNAWYTNSGTFGFAIRTS